MKEMAAMQRLQQENQARELELAANVMNEKKKLLTDLAKEEKQRDEEVRRLQENKEKEKEALMTSLYSGEDFCQ